MRRGRTQADELTCWATGIDSGSVLLIGGNFDISEFILSVHFAQTASSLMNLQIQFLFRSDKSIAGKISASSKRAISYREAIS
jgi:hypothetical protein